MIIILPIITIFVGAYIAWLNIVFDEAINESDCTIARNLGDVSKITVNPFESL